MNFNSVEFDRINRVQFDTFRSEADMLNMTEPVNQYREEKTTRRGGASWFCMADQIRKVVTRAFQRCAWVLRVVFVHHARASYAQVTMPAAGTVPTLHATAAPGLTPGVALKQRVARRLSVGIRIVTVVVLVFSANAIVARSCMRTPLRTVLRS